MYIHSPTKRLQHFFLMDFRMQSAIDWFLRWIYIVGECMHYTGDTGRGPIHA